MKILYHHRVAAQDGQSVHIQELVAAFKRRGDEVIFLGPSMRPGRLGRENLVLKILRTTLPQFILEMMEFAYSFRAYLKLKQAVLIHKPDFIYERYNLFLAAGYWLRKKQKIPYIIEVNAPLSLERAEHGKLSLQTLARRYERLTFQTADLILPVSNVMADIISELGASPEKILTLHNGIVRKAYEGVDGSQYTREHALSGKTVLGFIGFIRDWHGLDKIIEMMASDEALSDLILLAVGSGPAVNPCQALAKQLGIANRVHFVGFKNREDIPKLLSVMDITLQPAVTSYASPLKMFEYMGAGTAIVAPDQPNIREILTDEQTALLFDPDKPESARDAIARLAKDKDLRERLGSAARESISIKRFTWDDNAARIVERARQLISQ